MTPGLGLEMNSGMEKTLDRISSEKRHLEGGAHKRDPDLVSVCIPNHNKAKYLEPCIKSIANQTHNNIEIIIIDDGSTDSSIRVLDGILEKLSDSVTILLVKLDTRIGCAWAQNMAYFLAKGEYMANMDSDDVADPRRIEILIKEMQDKDLDMVGSNYNIIDDKVPHGTIITGAVPKISSAVLDSLCFGTLLFKHSVLEVTAGLNKRYIGSEDFDFMTRVHDFGFNCGYVDRNLYNYRRHKGQRSKLFHSFSV